MRARLARAAATVSVVVLSVSVPFADHPATYHCGKPRPELGEWRQFSVDLEGTREQTREHFIDQGAARHLQPHWTFDANEASTDDDGRTGKNSEITGYPVIADGCVFVGTSTGNQQPGWIFALNADTGRVVWRTMVSHGVYSTLAVHDGKVFAFVSRVGGDELGDRGGPSPWGPYVVALDQATGEILWQTTADWQVGADAVSSPIYIPAGPPFGDRAVIWVGVSGTAAEGDEGERLGYQGLQVFFDAETGERLRRTYTIPTKQERDAGYAGGAVWSTIAVDRETGFGYVGTGNPFNYDEEHEHTNAVLKMDLRSGPTFGDIVASYKGDAEQYFPDIPEQYDEVCGEVEELNAFGAGFECGNLDLDFGAQPNIFRLPRDERYPEGRKVVGIGQKSGVYHVFDPESFEPGDPTKMSRVWTSLLGVPSAVGGIVGTPAVDAAGIHGPHTLGGYVWSIERRAAEQQGGRVRWLQPLGDGVHWGNPVTSANGVVYTVDLKGFLSAFDAATGIPLLHRPMVSEDTWTDPTFTWGGVSVARSMVFASVGVGLTSIGRYEPPASPWAPMPNGFVIAFRAALPVDPFDP